MTETEALLATLADGPWGVVLLIAWAELRVLPKHRQIMAWLRAIASKLNVEDADVARQLNPKAKKTT